MGELIKQMSDELDQYLDKLIKQTKDEQEIINTSFDINIIDFELQD